jgi:hypothetical protein
MVPLMTRVPQATKTSFLKLAAELNRTPGALGRELIQAFCEGRVTLQPPVDPLYEKRHGPGN